MTEPVRLAQRVAALLQCSRAEAEQYVRNGWVRVDGRVVELPQHRVTDEHVEVDAGARPDAVEPATMLWHKPAGVDAMAGSACCSATSTD
jgi:23S rRNA pseudouridine2604 synthase